MRSIFQRKTKLFDNRIGKHLAGYARYLSLGFGPVKAAIERELKIFALADLLQSLVAHFLQRALDRFALRIQDTLLERDVNVSFHGGAIIIRQNSTNRAEPLT